jgi:hypothetical protein
MLSFCARQARIVRMLSQSAEDEHSCRESIEYGLDSRAAAK